jgi:ribosomal protein S18 acetylase RimI-like enzyme
MNLIPDIESLNKLIQHYFVKNTITNNYVMPDAYNQYIADSKLFYVSTDANLALLVAKNDFFQLYYYINNQDELLQLDIGHAVTMEILYRGESQYPLQIMSYWGKCGFKKHLTRDNMVASFQQLSVPTDITSEIGIRFAASESEIEFAKQLIESTLDKYTGDMLTHEEVRSFVENKNVICASLEGELCGILQFEIKNNVVWLGHISVAEGYRGKGVANELVKSYIVSNATQPNTRYQLWVIQDNIGAVKLYHKFGFIYGNKSSASMLKK